ncbi:MAG: hypothetical protein PHY04_02705 [Candidatus ainarchaeum sp.]|nr:hypothetical protein [Candidatus ainarchaeum sp.]MDD4128620.1 hypothetical protein [Candidatus ainarchaeum sp.]
MITRNSFSRVKGVAKYRINPRNSPTKFDSLAKPSGGIIQKLNLKKSAKNGLLSSYSQTKSFLKNRGGGRNKIDSKKILRGIVTSTGEEKTANLMRSVGNEKAFFNLIENLYETNYSKSGLSEARIGELIGGLVKGMGVNSVQKFVLNSNAKATSYLIKTIGVNNLVKLEKRIGVNELTKLINLRSAKPLSELIIGAGLGRTIQLIQNVGSVSAVERTLSYFVNFPLIDSKSTQISNNLIRTINKAGSRKVGELIKFADNNPRKTIRVGAFINYAGWELASELITKTNPKELALLMKEDSPFGVAMKIRKKGVNEFLKSLKQIN